VLPATRANERWYCDSNFAAYCLNEKPGRSTYEHFGGSDSIAHFLNSSLTKAEIVKVKEDVLAGKTKLLYVAPESLTKQENIDFLRLNQVSFVAVDEAHCISEWGHDFRPEYRKIRQVISNIGDDIPIIALTATATPKVQQDIQKTCR
jgi:ATP-dependent DNA helicase RecQ